MARKDPLAAHFQDEDFLAASLYPSDEDAAILVFPPNRDRHGRVRRNRHHHHHLQDSHDFLHSDIFAQANPAPQVSRRHYRRGVAVAMPREERQELSPRMAMKQLHDRITEARTFYQGQLTGFRKHHGELKKALTDGPMRQWLWREWTGSQDAAKKEVFSSTETIVMQHLAQVQQSFKVLETDPVDELVRERFAHNLRQLYVTCNEVIRLADLAMGDWQACRFVLAELGMAAKLADPEGKVHRHLFYGWDDDV